jgi:hypothetical protein
VRSRTLILRFLFTLTTFTCFALGQSQEISEPHRKWLECDLDWIFSKFSVGSHFVLKVSFHGTPVIGARIVLKEHSGGGVLATVKTDYRGMARFDAIPKGSYLLDSVDGLLFPSDGLIITVQAGRVASDKIAVDWPDDAIAVQNLRGRFSVSPEEADNVDIPLRNANIELRDLRTSRLIESAQTDANGEYEFATKDSGLYALRLTLPNNDGAGSDYHDLAIELDPTAKEIAIPEMKAVQSDCNGLQLFQRSEKDDTWEAQ